MFIPVRRVHSSAPLWLSRSFGFVRIIGAVLAVVVVIPVCWVHSGRPRGLSGSFGFSVFILTRPSDHCVHFGSLGSFERALGVVRLIRFNSGAPW